MHKLSIVSCFLFLATTYSLGVAQAKDAASTKGSVTKSAQLSVVGTSKRQWTGVAVAKDRRIFVNFPRWSDNVPNSVDQLLKDSSTLVYPDKNWNEWKGTNPADHFVCVQAVYVDSDDTLWIVDSAAPKFQGPVKDGPKLVKVNLKTNKVDQVFKFDGTAAPANSYLNDVRVDTKRKKAFLTDSGLGAILVVDLPSGKVLRRLTNHASTKAEDIVIKIDGKPWSVGANGFSRKIHSDGIAFDAAHDYLYYQALTARNLYRVPVKDLIDEKISEDDLGKKVELIAPSCVADGMEFGVDGNLYITSLEDNSVKRWSPAKKEDLHIVVQDKNLIWPDSLANSGDGSMCVTSSQINLGNKPVLPYKLFKFKLKNK